MMDALLNFFSLHGYVAEILLSTALFTFSLPRRKMWWLRIIAAVAVFFGISFLFNFLDGLFPVGKLPIYMPMIRYTVYYVAVVMAVWFVFDVKFLTALFLGIGAIATQHFSYKLGELLTRLLTPQVIEAWRNVIYVATLLLSYTAIYFICARKIKNPEREYIAVKQTIYIAVALVMYTTIFQYSTSMQMEYYQIFALYDMLCCAFTLAMLLSVLDAGKYMHEYKVSEHLAYQNKSQYDQAKKNMELLNIKYHDLKKMISNMGTGLSLDEKYELERAISIYDTTIKTDNEVLDVILTEKSMFCDQMGIRFERIVDGTLLYFMSNADLYSLLGNALDNAVEAVSKIENPEDRIITLMVRKAHGMVLIHVDNRYVGELKFENGLPLTTKGNKLYHGYGLKSIRNVVEKYDGSFDISTKDGLFELNIIFRNQESVKKKQK